MAYILKLFFILGLIVSRECQNIRLVGGPQDLPNSGRVEIELDEVWYEVCYRGENTTSDLAWNIQNVMTACRQLGYPGAGLAGEGRFGDGDLGRSVDDFRCQGDEDSIQQCIHDGPRKASCAPGDVAIAICAVPGYIGCYVDQLPRAMPYGELELPTEMSITNCIEYCRSLDGRRYAGVQDARQCFCGMNNTQYEQHGKAPEADCSRTTCPGNVNQACGWIWKMAVYDLSKGNCEDIGVPGNGSRNKSDNYPAFGSIASFDCEPGFVLIGKNVTQCILGSEPNEVAWSSVEPVCTESKGNCEDIGVPGNGSRNKSDTYPAFGSIASFDCEPGFVLIGKNVTQCILGSEPNEVAWSSAEPVCTEEVLLTTTPVLAYTDTTKEGKKPLIIPDEKRKNTKEKKLLLAVSVGVLGFALFVIIFVVVIFLICFVMRGKKKTRHRHSNSRTANAETGVNGGYINDSPNSTHPAVVVNNGEHQHSPPNHRHPNNDNRVRDSGVIESSHREILKDKTTHQGNDSFYEEDEMYETPDEKLDAELKEAKYIHVVSDGNGLKNEQSNGIVGDVVVMRRGTSADDSTDVEIVPVAAKYSTNGLETVSSGYHSDYFGTILAKGSSEEIKETGTKRTDNVS